MNSGDWVACKRERGEGEMVICDIHSTYMCRIVIMDKMVMFLKEKPVKNRTVNKRIKSNQ